MHNKAIVHILTKSRMKSDAFTAEIDAMEEVGEKYGIKNVIYYKGDVIEYKELINRLKKFGILLYNYSNKEELKEKVIEFNKKYEIVFISTPLELLVSTVNDLKILFGRPVSEYPDIFRDKYLQRELIRKHNPELGIKFLKGAPENLDINEIEDKVGYPFIIKPIDGVQSSGVVKVTSKKEFENYIETYNDFHDRLKNRGVDSKILIVEEFIDGKIYSVDYYVSSEGVINMARPIKVRLGIDAEINDYCNIARIASEKTEGEFKGKRFKTFINSTIKATGINNTFIHHEFKINSKGDFKTIELNGRIGGGRIELYKRAYDLNLYELLLNPSMARAKLKESNIAINIYASKRGLLTGINEKLKKVIELRKSVFRFDFDEYFVGKEVGLTKDGFVKVGVIKLKNKDYSLLRKDYLYIKSKYKNLLEIDEFGSTAIKAKGKINIFGKIKGLFKK